MKISNKGRYGVRAVFDIAFHNGGRPTQIRDISERQDIPPRFLEQIFQDLKRAGIVTSKRGPRGGYQLARPPAEISLAEILESLEGAINFQSPKTSAGAGDPTSRSITEEAFRDVSERVQECLAEVTIEGLCERGEQRGIRRGPPHRYVYSI